MKRLRFTSNLLVFAGFVAFLGIFCSAPSFAAEQAPASENTPVRFKPADKKEVTGPNKTLLIDDFNHLHTLNLLGGITQGDEEEPGGLIPTFTASGPLTMGRLGHSLKADYDVQVPASLAFYWTRFGSRDVESGPGAFFPVNLEGFNYVSFWVKSVKAYPRFAVEVHRDINNDHAFTLGKDQNAKIAVSSFIQAPTDDISGNTAEILVDLTQQAALPTVEAPAPTVPVPVVAPPPAPDAAKVSEIPVVPVVSVPPTPTAYTPIPRQKADVSQRRSRKKAVFVYTESTTTLTPAEEKAEKALIKPASKAEQKAEEAMVRPTAVSQVLGSNEVGPTKVVTVPQQMLALRQQKARWRKVVVPLSRFQLVADWSNILEMVFVFDNRLGSDAGILYIDDIVFGTNYTEPTPQFNLKTKLNSFKFSPVKAGISAAAIRAVEMGSKQEENVVVRHIKDQTPSEVLASDKLWEAQKISRERLKKLFDSDKQKDFVNDVEVPNLMLLNFTVTPSMESALESIRIEITTDGGKTWNILTSLYNHQADGEYVFPWRVPETQTGPLALRLVASDIWGRSMPISEPVSFKQQASGK